MVLMLSVSSLGNGNYLVEARASTGFAVANITLVVADLEQQAPQSKHVMVIHRSYMHLKAYHQVSQQDLCYNLMEFSFPINMELDLLPSFSHTGNYL